MDDAKIPLPDKTGSDGSQVRADTQAQELIPAKPSSMPMADAITGLASSNSRAFGGEVASTLVAGVASQMASELQNTKAELSSLRGRLDVSACDLTNERIKSAVLAERLHSFQATRHLKNVGVAIGTLLFGIGIQLARSGTIGMGVTAVVIGSVLILISWISVPRGGDK